MYECSLTFYQEDFEKIPNSCPNLPGLDPVFNYMNYVGSEHCLPEGIGEFSCGQIERMYKQWMLYREHKEECAHNEMKISVAMKQLDQNYSMIHMVLGPVEGRPFFDLARDMDYSHLVDVRNSTRDLNICVPLGEYVLAVSYFDIHGFATGAIELKINERFVHQVSGASGSTDCVKFDSSGKLGDLSSQGPDFFGAYRYNMPEFNITVVCAGTGELYLHEPIEVVKDRFMRVNVSMQNKIVGVCINEVTELDIVTPRHSVHRVFPVNDQTPVAVESKVLSCGDGAFIIVSGGNSPGAIAIFHSPTPGMLTASCIIEFDLARLADIYNPRSKDGVYNTTCSAK